MDASNNSSDPYSKLVSTPIAPVMVILAQILSATLLPRKFLPYALGLAGGAVATHMISREAGETEEEANSQIIWYIAGAYVTSFIFGPWRGE